VKNTRPCRAELPLAVWDRLAALAEADGVSLGTYARRVLTAHAEPPVSEEPDTPAEVGPTPDEWKVMARWIGSHPEQWAAYDGPRDINEADDRAMIYRWYRHVSGNGG
jgi:hypothetical protein